MEEKNMIRYVIAHSAEEFEQGRQLFMAYVKSLGVDLSFQDFDRELETINEQYNQPAGALILALEGHVAIGCVGVRKFDPEAAELKRMYVMEKYRGHGIGYELLKQAFTIAGDLGYKTMRLDTLKEMKKAQELYKAFGFYEIASYRFNPLEGAVYMEREVT